MMLSASCRGDSPRLVVRDETNRIVTTRTLYRSHFATRLYCWRLRYSSSTSDYPGYMDTLHSS